MKKKILFIASNYGLWAEELQGPWDALEKAGHDLTLATRIGKTPLPMKLSMDAGMVDPVQHYRVNPADVVDRVNEILTTGEWDHPIKIADANMDDYDSIVLVGGPGSPLDLAGNPFVHKLLLKAFKSDKIIGAICYTMASLALTRDPENKNKSIIYGKNVVAHPKEWDYEDELNYELVNTTPDNKGTDIVTQGFVFPLRFMVEDAVGPDGSVNSDPTTSREKPLVVYDYPFVTALSLESSKAFGDLLVEVLSK